MIGAEQSAAARNRLLQYAGRLRELTKAAQIPAECSGRGPGLPAVIAEHFATAPQVLQVKVVRIPVAAVKPHVHRKVVRGPESGLLILAEHPLVLGEKTLV